MPVSKQQHANIKLDCHSDWSVAVCTIRDAFRQQHFGQVGRTLYVLSKVVLQVLGIVWLGFYRAQLVGTQFLSKCGKQVLLVHVTSIQFHRGLILAQAFVHQSLLRRTILLVSGRTDGNFTRMHAVINQHLSVYYARLDYQTHGGM